LAILISFVSIIRARKIAAQQLGSEHMATMNKYPLNECKMPDLSALSSSNSIEYAIRVNFQNIGPKEEVATNLIRNFIRLVDQLVFEYESARTLSQQMISYRKKNPGDIGVTGYIFMMIGLLETTIVLLHRSILFAKALESINPEIVRLDPQIINNGDMARIVNFRHAIQHWDDRITGEAAKKGRSIVESGQANSMLPGIDGFELLEKRIEYEELSQWIRHIHAKMNEAMGYSEV